MKKTKEKSEFNIVSNILYSLKTVFKLSPIMFLTKIMVILAEISFKVYAIYETKIILDKFQTDDNLKNVLLLIVGLLVLYAVITLIQSVFYAIENYIFDKTAYILSQKACKLMCEADYDKLESPEYKNLLTQHMNFATAPLDMFYAFFELLKSIIMIVVFGTLVSTLHPLIFLMLVVMAVVHFFAKKPLVRLQHKLNIDMVANDRKFNYVTRISNDFENAKEVRLYDMSPWINEISDDCLKTHRHLHSRIQWRAFITGSINNFLNLLRDAFAYIYLIIMFSKNAITVGDFTMYFSAITSLSGTLTGLSEKITELTKYDLKIKDIRKTEKMPSSRNRGKGISAPKENIEIEFRNVSFRYPNAENDTIKNISFKIKAGEKLALVGVNGAGKTTIVKLLCGLYLPTEGEILLNSHPINDYNIYEYYSLFSAVFQDISLMPYSIAENIAATTEKDEIDFEKVKNSIEIAGLKERVDALPLGVDTPFNKNVNEGAVDFSGGEKQKLALARAIYLDRPMLILDEPTAALDPIAENEMYMKFNEISRGQTAMFISHRLASTRFCDRIIHLENGEIIENGTHDELIAANGKYAMMYGLQSKYYSDSEGGLQ